jgi:hypothetical protein
VFQNFNKRASELNIDRKKAWACLALKHDDAILKYCAGDKEVEAREPIFNRLRDRILYSFLLLGMIVEERQPTNQGQVTISKRDFSDELQDRMMSR